MMKIRFCSFMERWYKKNSHVYTHTHTDTHASLWRTGHVLLDRWFRKAGGESQAGWWPRGGSDNSMWTLDTVYLSVSLPIVWAGNRLGWGGLQSRGVAMQTINSRQGTKQSWDPGVDLDVRQTEGEAIPVTPLSSPISEIRRTHPE